MTDELYTLYLDVFTMKLSGVDGASLMRSLPDRPTMRQRVLVALALVNASLPDPGIVSRGDLVEILDHLLEVK